MENVIIGALCLVSVGIFFLYRGTRARNRTVTLLLIYMSLILEGVSHEHALERCIYKGLLVAEIPSFLGYLEGIQREAAGYKIINDVEREMFS